MPGLTFESAIIGVCMAIIVVSFIYAYIAHLKKNADVLHQIWYLVKTDIQARLLWLFIIALTIGILILEFSPFPWRTVAMMLMLVSIFCLVTYYYRYARSKQKSL